MIITYDNEKNDKDNNNVDKSHDNQNATGNSSISNGINIDDITKVCEQEMQKTDASMYTNGGNKTSSDKMGTIDAE